jgi:hypothetical protein
MVVPFGSVETTNCVLLVVVRHFFVGAPEHDVTLKKQTMSVPCLMTYAERLSLT